MAHSYFGTVHNILFIVSTIVFFKDTVLFVLYLCCLFQSNILIS